MAVSVVTIQLIYVSMGIMQVTTSVAFWQVSRCYFVTVMLVDLSATIMQVTVSVAVMQLEVSGAHMQVSFHSKYVSDNFYCNYADGSLCCNYACIFCSALCT